MDNSPCSLQHRKPTKFKTKPPRRKPHKPVDSPIKVVYISNPMRVKVSASEFRSLVQELTGQDSELPSDLSKFSPGGSTVDDISPGTDSIPAQAVPSDDASSKEEGLGFGGVLSDDDTVLQGLLGKGPDGASPFDEDTDEVFMSQMLDNLVALYPASSLTY